MITSLLSTWLLQRLTKCLKEGLLPFPELVCYVGGRFPPAKLKGVQREAIAASNPHKYLLTPHHCNPKFGKTCVVLLFA